jgi:hypothetical protein
MAKCFELFSEVTEFARPMSRRQATNRRELLLPSLIPARHQTAVVFDASVPPAPAAAIHSSGAEPPRYWDQQRIHYPAAKEASQTIEVVSPELIAGNHLLARLVFQQIRPRRRSAVTGGQKRSPEEPQHAHTPIQSPDIASPVMGCAETPVSAPVPPAVETLFIQLARRRLGGCATEETRR